MCLLTVAPPGVEHQELDLLTACKNNPDGFGYAIHTGRHIIRRRSMEAGPLVDRYLEERAQHLDGPALFHARIATSGRIDNSGCHPFYLPGNRKVVLAHNGVLPIKNDTGWRSDTRHLAEVVIPSHGGVAALRDPDYLSDLEAWMTTGNKVCIMSADRRLPSYVILNEKAGHWDTGAWWSNYSYYDWKPVKVVKVVTAQQVEDDEYLDDLCEEWPCPLCGEAIGEAALEDGHCGTCWYDLESHIDSVWCACDRCMRDNKAELDAALADPTS